MTRTAVVNKHLGQPYDYYIGRPSYPLSNMWSHLPGTLAKYRVDTREQAIEEFRKWFISRPDLIEWARRTLQGRVLGCFCRPVDGFKGRLLCHGQIIAGIIDGIDPTEVE